MALSALVDSNVVVAAIAADHVHHEASLALFAAGPGGLAVAAHSYAEAYVTLTRRAANAAFRWSAENAWAALEPVAAATTLVGLSATQAFDAIRSYAEHGGIGARVYDRLIGEVAISNRIPRLVTWNVGHMRDLFPHLDVRDPRAATAA